MQKSQETPEQADKTRLLAEVPSMGAEHHFQKMSEKELSKVSVQRWDCRYWLC